MILARFLQAGQPTWGIAEEANVYALEGDVFAPERARRGRWIACLDQVQLLPPATPRDYVVAIRRNYAAHIVEAAARGISNKPAGDAPRYLLKPTITLVGSGSPIIIPLAETTHVEHEGELAVVIGRRADHVAEAEAMQYVLGYTCADDMTARDVPYEEEQIVRRGKSFPTFTALGPWIVTGIDASDLHLVCRVNGKVRQDGRTSQMIFGLPQIIAEVSKTRVLEPGDVIITGTPAGFAALEPGDTVEVEIEGIGILSNPVIAG